MVNIITLIWGVQSWRKSLREKWTNNLRDTGAELIGAAEKVYAEALISGVVSRPEIISTFIVKEQKFLFLFADNKKEKDSFKHKIEALREAAESANANNYRTKLDEFSEAVNAKILKEWKQLNCII
ncbi:hypothetical protein [Synechococcus sp. BDU 130192]|uniref:hypothetical protein n=1 Tax=Synechococcus sp. BDU 130192 TaxID=2042059 RepID=UPI0011813ED3|nr:hypothetical protein [Synechococcus sp. BDU 130192]